MSARRFQLHNHFQLPCIFNDLLGQFCRRNSCFLCFLLLGAERVVSIRTLSPTSLQDKHKSKGEEGGKLQKYIKVTNENAECRKEKNNSDCSQRYVSFNTRVLKLQPRRRLRPSVSQKGRHESNNYVLMQDQLTFLAYSVIFLGDEKNSTLVASLNWICS